MRDLSYAVSKSFLILTLILYLQDDVKNLLPDGEIEKNRAPP